MKQGMAQSPEPTGRDFGALQPPFPSPAAGSTELPTEKRQRFVPGFPAAWLSSETLWLPATQPSVAISSCWSVETSGS